MKRIDLSFIITAIGASFAFILTLFLSLNLGIDDILSKIGINNQDSSIVIERDGRKEIIERIASQEKELSGEEETVVILSSDGIISNGKVKKVINNDDDKKTEELKNSIKNLKEQIKKLNGKLQKERASKGNINERLVKLERRLEAENSNKTYSNKFSYGRHPSIDAGLIKAIKVSDRESEIYPSIVKAEGKQFFAYSADNYEKKMPSKINPESYAIYLDKYSDRGSLFKSWRRIKGDYRYNLSNINGYYFISRKSLGRYSYHLIVGPLETSSQAVNICARIINDGGSCQSTIFLGHILTPIFDFPGMVTPVARAQSSFIDYSNGNKEIASVAEKDGENIIDNKVGPDAEINVGSIDKEVNTENLDHSTINGLDLEEEKKVPSKKLVYIVIPKPKPNKSYISRSYGSNIVSRKIIQENKTKPDKKGLIDYIFDGKSSTKRSVKQNTSNTPTTNIKNYGRTKSLRPEDIR